MKSAVSRVGAMLTAAAMLAAVSAWARDAPPLASIPLAPLGYQTLQPEFLLSGSSMLTVDFVDRNHLLVTFAVRRLMKREPGDPPDDEDRTVDAVLLELPSGKLLARTEWRLHDRWQYLWSLGHGRFLLRVRDRIALLAPLAAASAGDAFREFPLLRIDWHIVALMVSPDKDLLTLETTANAQAGEAASVNFGRNGSAQADTAPVQINFYRLTSTSEAADGLTVAYAGVVRAHAAIDMPMTTAGFLDVFEGGRDQWLFNFDEHAGTVHELAEWDTSCPPHSIFVGHSEFVALGCTGGSNRQALAGFNVKGEQMWQQSFAANVAPAFAFAPSAGRFAVERVMLTGAVDLDPAAPLPESMVSGQEVRVVQSYDGQLLLRIDCSPVERSGGNFALSEDGTRLAVVRESLVQHAATKDYNAYSQHEAAVEVYALPQLTEKDRAAVQANEGVAPKDTGALIDLALKRLAPSQAVDVANGTSAAAGSPSAPPSASALQTQVVPSGARADTVVLGDPVPDAPRKRPTLYGPDETPAGASTESKSR